MNQNMQGTRLSDQERMNDLMTQEKYLINSYSTFVPEASCPNLRKVLTDNLNQSCQSQFKIFDQISQLGWYPEKAAQPQDVTTAQQKFSQMKSQMSTPMG